MPISQPFNVPDFFYFTLTAGALGVALIPVLTDRYHKSGTKAVWELSNSLMNLPCHGYVLYWRINDDLCRLAYSPSSGTRLTTTSSSYGHNYHA
ncbi:MAG: hypothetical protein WDN66_05605 [Candidatus Saccharibacteria bacterium]